MKVQQSPFNFEQCMKCTICTSYCPMLAVNPSYPGPKQAGPDGMRFRIKDAKAYDEALKYCLNCKRCEVNCPSNVKVGDIIQAAKLKYNTVSPKLRDRMLANTDFVGTMASPFAPIVNGVLGLKPVAGVLDGVFGIDHRRRFPKYSGEKFVTWFKKNAKASQASYKEQVSYFHGCYVNYNFPQQGKDFVKVLNALGVGVNMLDGEKCCGVALISNGFKGQATSHAKANVAAIRKSHGAGLKTITTSTTCALTMRDEYPELLGVPNADIREDILTSTRYIYELIESGKSKVVFKDDYKAKIAYHTPCHLEKLGWGIYTSLLLKMIPGVEFIQLDQNCCGISGTFGFKKENYEYSQAIGKKLFDSIEAAAPDFVACDCETCKWQIEMSTPYKVQHPISILAEAIDLEKTAALNSK